MDKVRLFRLVIVVAVCAYLPIALSMAIAGKKHGRKPVTSFDQVAEQHARDMIEEGRQTFRFDTFGDEIFWGDVLKLHQTLQGERLGGVGPGVSPKTALALGLKVDVEALPASLRRDIQRGRVNLDDPATTLALLRLNAVVGVTGFFDGSRGRLRSVGIQCALCHSTVDNSFAPGIGHRLDGWANRDLDIGKIVASVPSLEPIANLLHTHVDSVARALNSWGPGKFDAELLMDGKRFQPNGRSAATLIPPAFGLAGINLHTWEGWGSMTHWNGFVANLEMRGQGTFFDPRLDNAEQFPIAAENRFGHITSENDRITAKLPALHFYQLALPAPAPPPGSFDEAAAERGDELFSGKAKCATCHTDELFTEPGWNMHRGDEIGIDNFQADRGPDHRYRTAPLKGLWTHVKGGFFHDGRFATLLDVVNHYNTFFTLALSDREKRDVVEYLKSLGDDVTPSVRNAHGLNAGMDADVEAAVLADSPGALLAIDVRPIPLERGGVVHVNVRLAAGAEAPDLRADVYDVAGRRIGALRGTPSTSPGPLSLTWDGRDGSGKRVGAGVYFVRVTAPSLGISEERRLVMR